MLSQYIQAPYVKTVFGLATPALIISIIYLLILAMLLICAKKKGALKIGIVKTQSLVQGDKNRIILSQIGYIVFIFSCITLPELLGEDNIILKISEAYLKIETLIFILLLAFLCAAFLNNTNRETHINAANCILRYLIWFSLGACFLLRQIDYAYWKNMVVVVCAWILNCLFFVIDIKPIQEDAENLKKFDLIPYGAVKSVNALFPSHREQTENIAHIISNSSSEPFSICLSGEWGSGKTSVINGVIELLKEKEEELYDIIFINALELDNKKTVLRYLMTQIREKLKSRGVYVGINSEYKEFASSLAGTLTSSAIGTLLQKKLANEDDYRAQKETLEEVLDRTYKKGKLIVVVDDIERCDRNTAREYLFLIKEVATMRSCVSVFVTNYDMLEKVVSDEKSIKGSPDFLNKFFNYKIDLRDESPKNILAFYDHYFDQRDPAFDCIYKIICKSPGNWYLEVTSGLTAKLDALRNDYKGFRLSDEKRELLERNIQQQQGCLSLYTRLMQNPRNVAKFYNVFRNHALYCAEQLRLGSNSDKVSRYINSRNIGQVLYLISFIEVFLPSEYEQLKRQGSQYLDPPLYGAEIIQNENRRLLTELAKGLIFGEYLEFKKPSGYIRADIKKFIESFVSRNVELYGLVDPFASHEEMWLNAIEKSYSEVIEEYWEEMVLMVFQKVPNKKAGITSRWRNEKFLFLLEFAEEQVKRANWASDKLFSLFDSSLHADRYWALGTGLMQTFWEHLNRSVVYTRPSKDKANSFHLFLYHYTYARAATIYKLMYYLIPLNDNDIKTDDFLEYLLNSNKSLGENLSAFLKRIEEVIPNFSFTSEGWYSNFKELADKINGHLVSRGIADYTDMREDILHMLDTAEEFRCLENVVAWIQAGEDACLQISSKVNSDDIDVLIDFFYKELEKISSDIDAQREFEKKFSDFFKKLQQAEGLILAKEQMKRLHQLVEKFVELFGVSSLPYRRTILKISEKNN